MAKSIEIVVIFCLFYSTLFGQSIKPNETIVGKWSICHSSKFNKNNKCDSILKYEFFENGTYIENRNTTCNYQQYIGINGKWIMKKNIMTLIEDEYCETLKKRQVTRKIKWINNDNFYVVGREGKNGPKVYTYFMRIG